MTAELQAKYDALPQQERFAPETVAQINANYVRDPVQLDDPTAFPGGHDVTGFPPTLIVDSDADSLRASGQRFAAELAAAGVDITVVLEPGTRHGHLDQPDGPGAVRTMQRITDWLGSTFAH
jgi:acetyl esterase